MPPHCEHSKLFGANAEKYVQGERRKKFIHPFAKALFKSGNDRFSYFQVSSFLAFTDEGSIFVYGYLVSKQPFALYALNESSVAYAVAKEINDAKAMNFVFMFQVLSVIFFFSFFVSMLFYLGAMQWVVMKLGYLLQVSSTRGDLTRNV